jgi:HAD superfamily hydrolase (TIGR01509 family)
MMQALLWDMNGVLINDEHLQKQAWVDTFIANRLEPLESWWDSFLGQRASHALAALFPDMAEQKLQALRAEHYRYYLEANKHFGVPILDGAVHLLESASKRNIPQALVTSNNPVEIKRVLDHLDAHQYFQSIVCGYDVDKGKPHPDCYLLAAKNLNVQAEDCWAIEDSLAGVRAAKNANIRCMALTTTLSAADLSEADLVVDELSSELLDHLIQLDTEIK